MSTPIPVAVPTRRSAFRGDLFPGIRLEEDLQSKRIKEVILPILAVLVGFFVLAFDTAILFTAVVIFGVFICGNGPTSRPLPPERVPFSNPPDSFDLNYNPFRDFPSPLKPSEKSTPYPPPPQTPVQGTPTFNPTPRTVQGVARWLGVSHSCVDSIAQSVTVSPQTFARGVLEQRLSGNDPSLELKQPRTSLVQHESVTPRNLATVFESND